MGREWTKNQQAAIDARGADVLVAAAAGSGKTAVLVERIIKRITEKENPISLDRLLVVTFTNAAAAEMRQRVGRALTEKLENEPHNAQLARQLALLPRAMITTIHAFCHKMLRANFQLLDLDPNFRLADVTEDQLLRSSALEEVIEEMYEDPIFAEDFLLLTESYMNLKNPEPFYELIHKIYDFALSLPHPEAWLTEAAERLRPQPGASFDEGPYAQPILAAGQDVVKTVLAKYDALLALTEYDDGGEALYTFLQNEQAEIAELLKETTYEGFRDALTALKLKTVPGKPKESEPKNREAVLKKRTAIKDTELKTLRQTLFLLDGSEQNDILERLYPLMHCLSEVVLRLMRRFDEKKRSKNLLNFNDLEHGCYRLLTQENGTPTELAKAERERFDEILIDEYQDTSPLQEAIFMAIHKPKSLFMVGDIKQSIYRFRNTDPLLFKEKKDTYGTAADSPQRKILLSQNFRSRADVLDSINYIFTRVMSEKTGELTYNEEEMLYPNPSYPTALENPFPQGSELWLTELATEDEEDGENRESAEAEAELAAQRITELMQSGYHVQAADGERPLAYRDICILLRSTKTNAPVFAKALADYGIPCYSAAGDSFLESREIVVMLSFLKIIDNPHQDIPLLAVLRSQLYALTPDELAEIRLADRKSDYFTALKKRAEAADALGERLQGFLDNLAHYREKSRQLSIAELVWYVCMQTGFYEAQATLRGGVQRRMNLRLLYTRAAAFEATGLKGLYSFIRFIDEYQSIGGDYDAARTIGEEQNVVRIMSIHKSKGLEFPVVFLCGLGRKFNVTDLQKKVLMHSRMGYGPKFVDTDLKLVYNNAAFESVKRAAKLEMLSEEMRILYVAMTRAREKLIMLAACKDMKQQIEKSALGASGKTVSEALTSRAERYSDWILAALLPHPDAAILRQIGEVDVPQDATAFGRFSIHYTHADDLYPELAAEAETTAVSCPVPQRPLLLDYTYPFESEGTLPAKVTVTEIKRRRQEPETDSIYLYPRPAFLREGSGKLTAAEAGTALHTVLEGLDYHRCDNIQNLQAQIDAAVQSGRLTEKESETISAQKLLRFMQSPIGKRLQYAETVRREVSFSLLTSAQELLMQPGQVLMQGMIDCVLFEKEGISILDYKTDRGKPPEELAERYRVQLDCYAKAAETLFAQKVMHKYLYLFAYDMLLEV